MRLWKGLYYCMWMSDKPLVQEELAESLSKLVHCFNNVDAALLYTKCTLNTLASEWFGIDQHRLDKFQMVSVSLFFNFVPRNLYHLYMYRLVWFPNAVGEEDNSTNVCYVQEKFVGSSVGRRGCEDNRKHPFWRKNYHRIQSSHHRIIHGGTF